MTDSTQNVLRPEDHVRTASRPSELKITDMRTATVGWNRWFFTIVRIDTNQGISGYGEVRDGAVPPREKPISSVKSKLWSAWTRKKPSTLMVMLASLEGGRSRRSSHGVATPG